MDRRSTFCEESGVRLDAFLSGEYDDISRNVIKKMILSGNVTVNGKQVKKPAKKLETGAQVEITVPGREKLEIEGEDIPLDVVYEDKWLLVINKQPGLVVHPGAGNPDGTLVNALVYMFEKLSRVDDTRPGIVHRLDKDTSGLMLVAKDETTHWRLSEMISAKEVKRIYYALNIGAFEEDSGIIIAPMGRSIYNRKKMAVKEGGKYAETHYQVIERYNGFSLNRFSLMTGRTHQIRVHASYLSHPVLGDPVYGGIVNRKPFKDIPRQMLHSKELSFIHPVTKKLMSFQSDIYPDMQQVMDKIINR